MKDPDLIPDWYDLMETVPGRKADEIIGYWLMGFDYVETTLDAKGEHGGDRILIPGGRTLTDYESVLPKLGPFGHIGLNHYSTHFRSAWEMVERLRDLGWIIRIGISPGNIKLVSVHLEKPVVMGSVISNDIAQTFPEAMARTVLQLLYRLKKEDKLELIGADQDAVGSGE